MAFDLADWEWDETKGPLQIKKILAENEMRYLISWKTGPDGVEYLLTWEPKEIAETADLEKWKMFQAQQASRGSPKEPGIHHPTRCDPDILTLNHRQGTSTRVAEETYSRGRSTGRSTEESPKYCSCQA